LNPGPWLCEAAVLTTVPPMSVSYCQEVCRYQRHVTPNPNHLYRHPVMGKIALVGEHTPTDCVGYCSGTVCSLRFGVNPSTLQTTNYLWSISYPLLYTSDPYCSCRNRSQHSFFVCERLSSISFELGSSFRPFNFRRRFSVRKTQTQTV